MNDALANNKEPGLENPFSSSPAKPAFTLNSGELLEKYKFVGEDHPSYLNLREALTRGQDAAARAAIAELEALRTQAKASGQAKVSKRARYPVWSAGCVVLLSLALSSAVFLSADRAVKLNMARYRRGSTNQYLVGEALGGKASADIAFDIIKALAALKPDRVLFAGHQLAKKEIVEYLSAISRTTSVRILLGSDAHGANQLTDMQGPLRQYVFTELIPARLPVLSQVLIAVNSRTKQGLALVGTYPFDVQDASKSEHLTVCLQDYNDCVSLYNTYDKLVSSSK